MNPEASIDDPGIDDPSEVKQVTAAKPSFWRKLGGGSLSLSVIIHVIILCLGAIWVFRIIPPDKPPKDPSFMPAGGGGGNPSSRDESRQRKAAMTRPNLPRVVVQGEAGRIVLPEQDESTQMASLGQIGSGMSGGLGGSGTGGGKGSGHGKGFGNGTGPGSGGMGKGPAPFSGLMFGKEIKADSIGVVLDVSGSMLPHLARVIDELDRVAPGSPLILYVGCGIGDGRPKGKTYPTLKIDQQRFERFWRLNHDPSHKPNKTLEQGSDDVIVDFTKPIPSEAIYKKLAARSNTFYLDYEGTKFSWGALVCKELKDVGAVYWFADFQDKVDDKEAESVMRRIRGKKQKLYIQVSGKGPNVPKIMELMVKPTDGDVIEVK